MPILLNKTIRLFLDSIGKREEYQYYLERFHAARRPAFALICPDRQGFEEVAAVFSFDLQFLLRLDIYPAILLCGEGALEMRDILFEGDHPCDQLDLSGRVMNRQTMADIERFMDSCREFQRVAVLLATGRTQMEVLFSLLPTVSRRVHFIRLRGPLHTVNGHPLQYYYTKRADQPQLAESDTAVAHSASLLLDHVPELHVSIASPWNLIEELFTVKGAGCLVRRGSNIVVMDDLGRLDRSKIENLMLDSFGRKIKPAAIGRAAKAFLEENYRGVALLEKHEPGWYLSKFAVGTQARGEGLAGEIWKEMVADNPALFWRARTANPINHWYRKKSDGLHRTGDWIVFWRNVDWRHIPEIVDYSLNRPDDFLAD